MALGRRAGTPACAENPFPLRIVPATTTLESAISHYPEPEAPRSLDETRAASHSTHATAYASHSEALLVAARIAMARQPAFRLALDNPPFVRTLFDDTDMVPAAI